MKPFLLAALALCMAVGSSSASDRVPASALHCGHTVYSRREPIPRDSRGRILRSASVRREFRQLTGWPHGRTGWQIDHVVPLKRAGVDCVCNLQWLPVSVKKVKDRCE